MRISKMAQTIVLIFTFFLLIHATLIQAEGSVPLDRACLDGKVTVDVSGLGGSTGDTIVIAVQRKIKERLRITLVPGTVFKSASAKIQNMAGARIKGERMGTNSYRPSSEILLSDDEKHSYIIEAYCMDFDKGNPGTTDSFSVTAPNPLAGRIISMGEDMGASSSVIQSAIWIERSGPTSETLKARFPVSDAEIDKARMLLQRVKTSPRSTAPAQSGQSQDDLNADGDDQDGTLRFSVKAAQKALSDLGYEPGPIDDLWGQKTADAIAQFQRDRGLPVTSCLDSATGNMLGLKPVAAKASVKKTQRLKLVLPKKTGNSRLDGALFMSQLDFLYDQNGKFQEKKFDELMARLDGVPTGIAQDWCAVVRDGCGRQLDLKEMTSLLAQIDFLFPGEVFSLSRSGELLARARQVAKHKEGLRTDGKEPELILALVADNRLFPNEHIDMKGFTEALKE